ncbi:MAG: SDR family NAD(P)-dependent oxidoreductase [Parvibaculaceae bacterium]
MTEKKDGPVIIVTGAGKGLGKAIAQTIVESGGRVVLVIRSPGAESPFGDAAITVTRDVNAPDAAEAALSAAQKRWGRVDGLVNNAGLIDPIARIAESDPALWAKTVETNLLAPYRFIRAFLAVSSSTPRRIVNISSGAAHRPLEGWNAYCASKAGLAMLTRSVHLEYGKDNILAFGFTPGLVDTDMQSAIRASGVNDVSRLPKSALRPASEPARAVAYLLSGAGDDLAGGDVDIRDQGFRQRAGLSAL